MELYLYKFELIQLCMKEHTMIQLPVLQRKWVGAAFPLPTVFTFCILRLSDRHCLIWPKEKQTNQQTSVANNFGDRKEKRHMDLKIIQHTGFQYLAVSNTRHAYSIHVFSNSHSLDNWPNPTIHSQKKKNKLFLPVILIEPSWCHNIILQQVATCSLLFKRHYNYPHMVLTEDWTCWRMQPSQQWF